METEKYEEIGFDQLERAQLMGENEWTYLAFDGEKYKIGKSDNPEKRVEGLKTANPSIALVAKTQKVSEKVMHKIFEAKRLDREWFYFLPNDLERIADLFQVGIDYENYNLALYHFQKKRKEVTFEKYVIGFGRYGGTKLIDMVDHEQLSYIKWYLDTSRPNKRQRKICPYAGFKWWLEEAQKAPKVKEAVSIKEEIQNRKSEYLANPVKNVEGEDFGDDSMIMEMKKYFEDFLAPRFNQKKELAN